MRRIKTALILFALLAIITGGIYPAIVTLVARTAFPAAARGSLIFDAGGNVLGSSLIGQQFSDAKYFWPRPSSTADHPYNAMASGGSQLGPTNPELAREVSERIDALKAAGVSAPFPSDLVTSSASGLDPHISPEAALVQIPRVAKARGMNEDDIRSIVFRMIEDRALGFIGAPRVNVLQLNIKLGDMEGKAYGKR